MSRSGTAASWCAGSRVRHAARASRRQGGWTTAARSASGRLTAEADDAARLADLLPAAWRLTPALWHGPASLDAQFAGPEQALAGRVRLALGGGELEVSPTIDLASGDWSASLALHHPGARRLIATLGLPERIGLPELPAWLDDGSLSLVAHLTGAPGHVDAPRFDLRAATLHVSGDLALDRSGAEPQVTGHIGSDALTLPLPDGASNVPLPLGVLRGWRGDVQLGFGQLTVGAGPALHDAAVRLSVANGALRLGGFRREAWRRKRDRRPCR